MSASSWCSSRTRRANERANAASRGSSPPFRRASNAAMNSEPESPGGVATGGADSLLTGVDRISRGARCFLPEAAGDVRLGAGVAGLDEQPGGGAHLDQHAAAAAGVAHLD